MAISSDDLRLLKATFGDGVQSYQEGELPLVVLPVIYLPAGCHPPNVMAIYVAKSYQGYDSRLFLESPIKLASGVIPATAQALLLGRTMYAASIQGIPATLPPHQAILAHLQRYKLAA